MFTGSEIDWFDYTAQIILTIFIVIVFDIIGIVWKGKNCGFFSLNVTTLGKHSNRFVANGCCSRTIYTKFVTVGRRQSTNRIRMQSMRENENAVNNNNSNNKRAHGIWFICRVFCAPVWRPLFATSPEPAATPFSAIPPPLSDLFIACARYFSY